MLMVFQFSLNFSLINLKNYKFHRCTDLMVSNQILKIKLCFLYIRFSQYFLEHAIITHKKQEAIYSNIILMYLKFQYELIIKKIPHIFMKIHKNDQQLPSKQEIQQEFGSSQGLNPITLKVKELTVLCYDLLKIQIPFFSKKSKESSNNMRMIVQIYCQLPKNVEPIKRTQLQKILLKNKMKKNIAQKYVRSIQELKIIHNDYNNYYYWANDSLDKQKDQKQKKIGQQPIKMTKQAIQQWLQGNVWRYFD